MSSDGQSRRVSRRMANIAVLIVGVLAVAGSAYWFFFLGPGRPGGPPGGVLVQMSGESDSSSAKFYARSGWYIQWETTGQHFSYTIRGDYDFGQVINQNGPGNGITSPVPTGNFFIVVAAEGPWSITVYQGE